MDSRTSIAIFGGGNLQLSLIMRCKALGFIPVVLDPNENAVASKNDVIFEIVAGDDFEHTCEVIRKHDVKGIVTSSTDKPLIMMARIAQAFKMPFISIETAALCTDKFKMKQVFLDRQIKCAQGILVSDVGDIPNYPVIIKPLDNSGSRGVYYCSDRNEVETFILKAKSHTKQDKLLCEEFLHGEEYSVESIHHNGSHKVVQITEKITSPLPYQVEMGHIAPANLSEETKKRIEEFVNQIALVFDYNYCVAHTEIKINNGDISVIETSPRLGGDFITSKLVPYSTGVNMEECLINMAMGQEIDIQINNNSHTGIFYIKLLEGIITQIDNLDVIKEIPGVVDFNFTLKKGDKVGIIANSLDRYGYFIINLKKRCDLDKLKEKINLLIGKQILINKDA